MSQDDPNRPEVLTSVRTEAEAAMIVNFLENEGIRAKATGFYSAEFRAEAPGTVKVLVAISEHPRAKLLLEAIRKQRD